MRCALLGPAKPCFPVAVRTTARLKKTLVTEVAQEFSPPLKWAGGKRWLVPALQEIWLRHADRRLVEPMCGGLAVTLGLRPTRALLNDVNPHLINFYSWLRRGLAIKNQMANDQDFFYKARDQFNDLVRSGCAATEEAAGLFYFLNRTGFNGLCRFNRSGQFNVPFGRYAKINYRYDFSDYKPVLSSWDFSCGDFEALPLSKSDFIYADPPYDVPFTQYSTGGFRWDDQVRLAEWLSKHKGPVVASNQATERIMTLYAKLGFRCLVLAAPRMISCTGDRSSAQELFATKGLS
jgi:DNA adenine methylase